MITFEEIRKANEAIKTTNVKGKDYAEVNQRIKAFRMIHPNGAIKTFMQSNEGGVCVFRAEIYDGDGNHIGTGHAYEKEGSSNINRTSYIENCETSAVGRALGMCGFGIDTSVASAEEVQTAMMQQEAMDKAKEEEQPPIPETHCERCDAIIQPVKGRNGKPVSVVEIVRIGQKNHNGAILCAKCQSALAKAAKANG